MLKIRGVFDSEFKDSGGFSILGLKIRGFFDSEFKDSGVLAFSVSDFKDSGFSIDVSYRFRLFSLWVLKIPGLISCCPFLIPFLNYEFN